MFRFLERMMARASDRLIAVSQATADDLVRLRVARRELLSVIPIGLELDRFGELPEERERFRASLDLASGDVVATYVGRLVPIKRLDRAIEAVALARKRGAPIRLVLVGDGECRARLQRYANELGVREVTSFTGYRTDLASVIAGTDIALLTSDNEGTPVFLIEAAAGARPAVATSVGGVPEVVTEASGLLGRLTTYPDWQMLLEGSRRIPTCVPRWAPWARHMSGSDSPQIACSPTLTRCIGICWTPVGRGDVEPTVLHIGSSQFGSVETAGHTLRIWTELAKGAPEYHVLARNQTRRFGEDRSGNLHLHLVPGLPAEFFLGLAYMALPLARRYRPNVILCQDPVLGGLAAVHTGRVLGVPVLMEIHTDVHFRGLRAGIRDRAALGRVARYALRRSTAVRAVSPRFVEPLVQAGVAAESIIHIPYRVDLGRFERTECRRRQGRAALGLKESALVVTSVGRFVPQKGYAELVAGFSPCTIDCPKPYSSWSAEARLATTTSRLRRVQAFRSPCAWLAGAIKRAWWISWPRAISMCSLRSPERGKRCRERFWRPWRCNSP